MTRGHAGVFIAVGLQRGEGGAVASRATRAWAKDKMVFLGAPSRRLFKTWSGCVGDVVCAESDLIPCVTRRRAVTPRGFRGAALTRYSGWKSAGNGRAGAARARSNSPRFKIQSKCSRCHSFPSTQHWLKLLPYPSSTSRTLLAPEPPTPWDTIPTRHTLATSHLTTQQRAVIKFCYELQNVQRARLPFHFLLTTCL